MAQANLNLIFKKHNMHTNKGKIEVTRMLSEVTLGRLIFNTGKIIKFLHKSE